MENMHLEYGNINYIGIDMYRYICIYMVICMIYIYIMYIYIHTLWQPTLLAHQSLANGLFPISPIAIHILAM